MKIKRYFAVDMRRAIRQVQDELGPDAVILSNQRVDGGVEVVVAVNYDEELVQQMVVQQSLSVKKDNNFEIDTPNSTIARKTKEPELSTTARSKKLKPSSEIVWSQDPALISMREELHTLRGILEGQLTNIAWGQVKDKHPMYAQLLRRLHKLGLNQTLCRDIAGGLKYEKDPEHNWRQALGFLSKRIVISDDAILDKGGVVALVGPTGVGKTTTIAKLAARYTLRHGSKRVALVTTDSYRVGAHQQLKAFARILSIPVHVANDSDELHRILTALQDKDLVLIDTAGMNQRDIRVVEQLDMLRKEGSSIQTYAVLSTTSQRAALEDVVQAFERINLSGCILTKVDETSSLGEALSVVIQHKLPVSYIADGQRVPEDLHPARANNLITRSVALMQRIPETVAEPVLPATLNTSMRHAHG